MRLLVIIVLAICGCSHSDVEHRPVGEGTKENPYVIPAVPLGAGSSKTDRIVVGYKNWIQCSEDCALVGEGVVATQDHVAYIQCSWATEGTRIGVRYRRGTVYQHEEDLFWLSCEGDDKPHWEIKEIKR